MAETIRKMFISTTEPNNSVGLIKIRQGDENSQVLDVKITENGLSKNFKGLQPFFCVMARRLTGQGVSEELVTFFDENKGTLRYTVSENVLQMVGKNEAYFSFRKENSKGEWLEQFSTRTFTYVVEKGVYTTVFKDSNYWWTFKELYRLFTKNIEDSKTDWQAFIDSNKEILNDIDPGGKVLSEIIAAREADDGTVFESLKDRLDQYGNSFEIGKDYTNSDDVRDVFKPELVGIKNGIDQKKFNFIVCTDVHYEERYQPYYDASYLSLTRISNTQFLSDKVDAVIYNGDNCQSDSYTMNNVVKQYDQFAHKVFDYDYKSDVYVTLGNHDDGSGRSASRIRRRTLPPDQILKNDDFKKIFKTKDLLNGETREDGDSLYCFKDYPDKKIRMIILNSSDVPDTLTKADGTIKWLRWITHAYLQKQLKWLSTVALKDVPSDYHVMVVAHCPLQFGWDMASSTHHNHDMVKNLLVAFRDGKEYTAYSSDPDEEFNAAISVDFSAQGPRNLIGFFSGHLHNEQNYKVDGINNITCDSSIPDDGIRKIDMPDEDSQSIITIDTDNRMIIITGFGAAINRSYSY